MPKKSKRKRRKTKRVKINSMIRRNPLKRTPRTMSLQRMSKFKHKK